MHVFLVKEHSAHRMGDSVCIHSLQPVEQIKFPRDAQTKAFSSPPTNAALNAAPSLPASLP